MNWEPFFARRTAHMRRSAIRELLKVIHRPGMISFAGGIPAPELFPVKEVAQAVQTVLARQGGEALQYGATEGVTALREWVAARFSKPGFEVGIDNVLIVTGSQQGLDLIGKVFLDPGDRVLVENPTYLALLMAWRPFEPVFVPVSTDGEGMCVEQVPALLEEGAKLVYTVPNFQNPQGTTLSLKRRRLLAEAVGGRAILVEDDPYGELRYEGEPVPSLIEIDAMQSTGLGHSSSVIHLGSFSKVLAPGFRVGWVIAPAEVVSRLVQAKQAADLHTSTFCQHVVVELVRNGFLEEHVPKLREAYRARRDAMVGALTKYFPGGTSWTRPKGGMFLLVTLPGDMNAEELLPRALEQQVAFVPGTNFFVDSLGTNTFRLNFSFAPPEQIEIGIRRLAAVLSGITGQRAIS